MFVLNRVQTQHLADIGDSDEELRALEADLAKESEAKMNRLQRQGSTPTSLKPTLSNDSNTSLGESDDSSSSISRRKYSSPKLPKGLKLSIKIPKGKDPKSAYLQGQAKASAREAGHTPRRLKPKKPSSWHSPSNLQVL